jgi:hypothetical protein
MADNYTVVRQQIEDDGTGLCHLTTGMIALIETQKIIGVGKRRVKDSLASFSSPCRDAEEGGISVEGRSPRARCWRGSVGWPRAANAWRGGGCSLGGCIYMYTYV